MSEQNNFNIIKHDILHLLTFVSLSNYSSNVPNDVVIELYEVDRPQLDVGVVQILGVLVKDYQLLLRQIDNLQTRNIIWIFFLKFLSPSFFC